MVFVALRDTGETDSAELVEFVAMSHPVGFGQRQQRLGLNCGEAGIPNPANDAVSGFWFRGEEFGSESGRVQGGRGRFVRIGPAASPTLSAELCGVTRCRSAAPVPRQHRTCRAISGPWPHSAPDRASANASPSATNISARVSRGLIVSRSHASTTTQAPKHRHETPKLRLGF